MIANSSGESTAEIRLRAFRFFAAKAGPLMMRETSVAYLSMLGLGVPVGTNRLNHAFDGGPSIEPGRHQLVQVVRSRLAVNDLMSNCSLRRNGIVRCDADAATSKASQPV